MLGPLRNHCDPLLRNFCFKTLLVSCSREGTIVVGVGYCLAGIHEKVVLPFQIGSNKPRGGQYKGDDNNSLPRLGGGGSKTYMPVTDTQVWSRVEGTVCVPRGTLYW